ncbi:MAG: thiol peroxidase [Candidatus Cloacimonetes bacterium]|nr:thiol peroxidase [Candidatus Cloacimonadota bacterium]MBS3767896.1 thiol peroxidase [Candidatus Cloacimonadota bacterium]
MAITKLKGTEIKTNADLPQAGKPAPEFTLTNNDLEDVSLQNFLGSKLILNIFPSLDTPVCSMSVRKFNSEAENLPDTKVLCISRDLPFAQKRFCGAEGLDNVITLSEMRDNNFSDAYGVRITEGPMSTLFARAVIILDEEGVVRYVQLVPEITQEPDYEDVLNNLNKI